MSRLALVVLATGVTAGLAACVSRGPSRPGPATTPAAVEPPRRATLSGSAPPSFVRSVSEARTTRVLAVRDGLGKQAVFRAATDVLGQKFTVDVSDPRAGYLMTTWQASYVREGVPDLRYRTRLVVRFLGDDWKQVSVRSEANWQRAGGDDWEVGYDSALLDRTAAELKARIGKRG